MIERLKDPCERVDAQIEERSAREILADHAMGVGKREFAIILIGVFVEGEVSYYTNGQVRLLVKAPSTPNLELAAPLQTCPS